MQTVTESIPKAMQQFISWDDMYCTALASVTFSVDESLPSDMESLDASFIEDMHIRYCAYVDKFNQAPYRFKGSRNCIRNVEKSKCKTSVPRNLTRDIGVLCEGVLEKKGRAGTYTKRFFRLIASTVARATDDIFGSDRLEIYERKICIFKLYDRRIHNIFIPFHFLIRPHGKYMGVCSRYS